MSEKQKNDCRVLVIDDDRSLTVLINSIFSGKGYEITVAHTAEDVADLFGAGGQALRFDLILLDLNMPEMSGVDLYHRLRRHPQTADIPIIVVSAVDDIEKRVELFEMGVDDYIVKPFYADELLARAEIHIKLAQLRQAKQAAEARADIQARHLAAINKIGSLATRYLDLEFMLKQVAEGIITSFACETCAIYLDVGDALYLVASCPPASPPASAVPATVQRTRLQQESVRGETEAAVPIIREEALLGVLFVQNNDAVAIPAETVQALEILAVQLATAVTNASLFQDIQKRNRQLQAIATENSRLLVVEQQQRRQTERLHQMAQIIGSSLEMEDVLNAAMDSIRAMFQVEAGSIILRDESSDQLTFAGSLDEWPALQHAHIPHGRGIVGYVVREGQPLIVNDAQDHPQFFSTIDEVTGKNTYSVLCVPLVARDSIIGAIELINKKEGLFTEMDLTLLSSVAISIAVAIDNARLYREQAELVQQLQLSQEQLVQSEKLAATGRLAASLAHEINNPLQAIHSCLQLTVQFELDKEKQDEYLHMASEEVERLIDIVTRILDFARPSSGERQPVNFNKIIGEVLRLSRKHVSHHNWSIQQVLASDLPRVSVIPDQIAQVFLCIILNAFDAMDNEGTLTIKTQLVGEWVEATFQDTGKGIPPEVQERIFEPFYSTKASASGLGLTISYRIIESHGGTIQVESDVGKGSTFTVRLPRS